MELYQVEKIASDDDGKYIMVGFRRGKKPNGRYTCVALNPSEATPERIQAELEKLNDRIKKMERLANALRATRGLWLTLQEIFDISAKHLLSQNCKSQRPHDFRCYYRGPNDLQCAAGPLVLDGMPEKFNHYHWGDVPNEYKVPHFPHDNDAANDLVNHLQEVHDSHDVQNWRTELAEVADMYGLNKSVL